MPSLLLTSPPATEPLTLAEAKTYLRVEHDLDNDLITNAVAAVRQACESATGRALITQGWRLLADCTSALTITLPKAPLQHVTAISSLADDGTAMPLGAADYTITADRLALRQPAGTLRIDFIAGYGDSAADVPAALRQGMLQHLAQLYASRGDTGASALPAAALALYQPYRLLSRP